MGRNSSTNNLVKTSIALIIITYIPHTPCSKANQNRIMNNNQKQGRHRLSSEKWDRFRVEIHFEILQDVLSFLRSNKTNFQVILVLLGVQSKCLVQQMFREITLNKIDLVLCARDYPSRGADLLQVHVSTLV